MTNSDKIFEVLEFDENGVAILTDELRRYLEYAARSKYKFKARTQRRINFYIQKYIQAEVDNLQKIIIQNQQAFGAGKF